MRYMTARVSTRDGGPTAQFRFGRLIVNYVVFLYIILDLYPRGDGVQNLFWPLASRPVLSVSANANRAITGRARAKANT